MKRSSKRVKLPQGYVSQVSPWSERMAKGQRSKQQLYLLTVVISSLSTSLLITVRFTTKLTLAGTLQLDLTALIKPASSARSCKLPDTTNPAPTLDLFKQKRCYGWWSTSSSQTGTLRDTVGTLQNTTGLAGSSLSPPEMA